MYSPPIPNVLAILTLALVPLLASAQQPGAAPKTLRVLTYNIHHGEGLDKKLDLPRIAAVIKSTNPDLVAIQEVDLNTKRTNNVDTPAELAKLTGLHAYFAKAMDYQGGAYGQLLLSKHPLEGTKTHLLPPAEQGVEPRIMAEAHVKIGNTSIAFFGTHLDARDNARPDSKPLSILTRTFTDPSAGKNLLTIPAEKPKYQIDYVLYRPKDKLHPVDVKVIEEPVASDHRPVLAVFELR